MTYISVAFKEEAKVLLRQWRFKQDKTAPCKLYVARDVCLLVTQMGQSNALKSLEALLSYLPPKNSDVFINFGICAAPAAYSVGEVLECSHIYHDNASIVLKSTCNTPLTTVDAPASRHHNTAVDMEAFVLFQTARHRFKTCHCIKVVSDHFKPLHVRKETIAPLLAGGVTRIKEIVHENRCCHRS